MELKAKYHKLKKKKTLKVAYNLVKLFEIVSRLFSVVRIYNKIIDYYQKNNAHITNCLLVKWLCRAFRYSLQLFIIRGYDKQILIFWNISGKCCVPTLRHSKDVG